MALPKLAAHRGLGDPYTALLGIPENSLKSIKWAADHGAWVVEGDCQLSGKDAAGNRTMFMMHDDDLSRTTNGTGDPQSRSWAYIKERWLEIPRDNDGNGDADNTTEHPPSFRAWLEVAKAGGTDVFIELKGDYWPSGNIKKFCEEIAKQGMTSKVIIAGNRTKLGYVKKYLPGARRSWNLGDYPSVATIKSVIGTNGYTTLKLADCESHKTYVANVVKAGIKLIIWTLDTSGHYERALPFNAHAWFVDNVEHAAAWQAAHAA